MVGYIVKGEIDEVNRIITFPENNIVKIKPPNYIPNACFESLTLKNDTLVVFYEANGKNVNKNPVALLYDLDLNLLKHIPIPSLEYRITDASVISNNCFYILNNFWSGDEKFYKPAADIFFKKFGLPKNMKDTKDVKRILKLRFTKDKIITTNEIPTYIELAPAEQSYNWEGLVTYDKRGFIIATDKYPTTILAYIKK